MSFVQSSTVESVAIYANTSFEPAAAPDPNVGSQLLRQGGAVLATVALAASLVGCTPRTRNQDGYAVDDKGNCAERSERLQKECLTNGGTSAGPADVPAEVPAKAPHNTPFGEELIRQTTQGYNWQAFFWKGERWDWKSDGEDIHRVHRITEEGMLGPGESATKRDRAAAACTLASVVMIARKDVGVPPVGLDVPQNILERIRAGAFSASDLLGAGLSKFREAASGGDDPDSGHYDQAGDFCYETLKWILTGYSLDRNSEIARVCGPACRETEMFPVPVGVRG